MKFHEGKIVSIFYINRGKALEPVIIRYPKKSDVKEVWRFYNKVIKETEFLSRITPVSLKDEKKWIGDNIEGIKKRNKMQLFAEHNGKVVGSVTIERKSEQRKKHIGGFGICILQAFTGVGLGRRMMIAAERESTEMNLKVLELSVYGRNRIAQSLYKKMGFRIAGKIPKSIRTRKGFDDDIIMYKVLK